MPYSNTDTILLYGLTAEERQAVDAANRRTNYQYFEVRCVTDLLAVPHLALVADPNQMSGAAWVDLMDYYRQAPEDGEKVFFTRPVLVPSDVSAAFHFPEGVKDLQWQLTSHLYRHAQRSGKQWDRGWDLRKILCDHAKSYPYLFYLCAPKDIGLLADLQAAAGKMNRLFVCTQKQSDAFRYGMVHLASRQLWAAARQSGKVTFRFDFEPVLVYEEKLLPRMEKEGFLMPIQSSRDPIPILKHFNNGSSLLLYPLRFLNAAADIADWWQGESIWDGVSLKSSRRVRQKEFVI